MTPKLRHSASPIAEHVAVEVVRQAETLGRRRMPRLGQRSREAASARELVEGSIDHISQNKLRLSARGAASTNAGREATIVIALREAFGVGDRVERPLLGLTIDFRHTAGSYASVAGVLRLR
jgi:hypothetical protein